MIVGRLTISYDRGTARNAAQDIGLDAEPEETASGGIVRGLGSHWRDRAAQDHARDCAAEEQRVRNEFRRAFLASPLPGVYVVESREAIQELLARVQPDPRLEVSLSVYDLTPQDGLPEAELREWTERIQSQLTALPLGRGTVPAEQGLAALERLAACPIFAPAVQTELNALVATARLGQLDRSTLRRRIAAVPVVIELGSVVAPRRVAPVTARAPSPVNVA